jgi:excisionase family DNA binding protein
MLQLVSLDSVAQSLGVSRHTVRAFVRQGRLTPTKICRRLLFDPADVETFVGKAQRTSRGDLNGGANDWSREARH